MLGNQARNVWAERFANRTSAEFGIGRFDLDAWITHKRLHHPIFQVLDQDGLTWGVAPRFATTFDVAGLRSELVVGARYFAGTNEALQYVNTRGSRGRQTLDARQDARNYEASDPIRALTAQRNDAYAHALDSVEAGRVVTDASWVAWAVRTAFRLCCFINEHG